MASVLLSPPASEPEWHKEKSIGGFWQRLTRGFRKLIWRGDWEAFNAAGWPDQIMTLSVTDCFFAKQGRSIGRVIWENGERRLSVYLKRHYQLSWWRGLMATLFPKSRWSPGWQEARNLEWARQQGVPVPEVVAAGEMVGPGGKLQSFLAIEELHDMLPLHEAIPLAARNLDARTFSKWKAGLVAEMARLTRLLHDRCYFHKDLYLCHFYVARADLARLPRWPGNLYLIDFHRLARHAWTSWWWKAKDLGQLLYSTQHVEGLTPRDRLRFWRHYLGKGRKAAMMGWLIRVRGGQYLRHNRKRKTS